MRVVRSLGSLVCAIVLGGTSQWSATLVAQQPTDPIVTSVDALVREPAFFSGKLVTIAGTPVNDGGQWRLGIESDASRPAIPVFLVPDLGPLESKPLELTGRFGAIGSRLELTRVTWVDDVARAASIRDVVLHAARWAGRPVTLRGQFRGRNLANELPDRLSNTPSDFVLQNGPAAIWVAGLQPRGRGFDLDPTTTRDVGRWLDVSGIVRLQNGEVRLDGTAIAAAPAPLPVAPPPSYAASSYRLPRPKVVFTAPVDREVEVEPDTTVRVQFSRDMREASFTDQVQVTYATGTSATPPPFTITYRVRTRSLTLKFSAPLALGTTVLVRLGPNMAAMDGSFADPVEFSFRVAGGQSTPVRPSPDDHARRSWSPESGSPAPASRSPWRAR